MQTLTPTLHGGQHAQSRPAGCYHTFRCPARFHVPNSRTQDQLGSVKTRAARLGDVHRVAVAAVHRNRVAAPASVRSQGKTALGSAERGRRRALGTAQPGSTEACTTTAAARRAANEHLNIRMSTSIEPNSLVVRAKQVGHAKSGVHADPAGLWGVLWGDHCSAMGGRGAGGRLSWWHALPGRQRRVTELDIAACAWSMRGMAICHAC